MCSRQPFVVVVVLLAAALFAVAGCKSSNITRVSAQTDTFVQTAENPQIDAFSQRPAQLDILFVLDNQPYMCAPSQKLASEFQIFISQLNTFGLDFQIGVITSDMADSEFQGQLVADKSGDTFLSSSMSSAMLVDDFGEIIGNVGSNGPTNSQPLLAAAAALQPPLSAGPNVGFVRPTAALAVIVVDDEDDYSLSVSPRYSGFDAGVPIGSDGGVLGDPVVAYFDRIFKSLKGPGNDKLVSVSGIVGAQPGAQPPVPAACTVVSTPEASCMYDYPNADPAYRILQIVADTGGLGQSLCQQDFSVILKNLGQLLGGATTSFAISTNSNETAQIFAPSTLSVSVITPTGDGGPQSIPESATDGWSYNAQTDTVQFNGGAVPVPGSQILISFATLNSAFGLTYPPVLSTLQVTVRTGNKMTTVPDNSSDPVNGYSYDPQSNAIVFPVANLPPLGATVSVQYQTA